VAELGPPLELGTLTRGPNGMKTSTIILLGVLGLVAYVVLKQNGLALTQNTQTPQSPTGGTAITAGDQGGVNAIMAGVNAAWDLASKLFAQAAPKST
jgi:hypothetical protein